jgi:hypothetical protein
VYSCTYLCCHSTSHVKRKNTLRANSHKHNKSYYTASNLQPHSFVAGWVAVHQWVVGLSPASWQKQLKLCTVTPCHRHEKIWGNTITSPIKNQSTQKWIQWACWQGQIQLGKQSNKLPHDILKEKVAKWGTMTMANDTKKARESPFLVLSIPNQRQNGFHVYGYRCLQGQLWLETAFLMVNHTKHCCNYSCDTCHRSEKSQGITIACLFKPKSMSKWFKCTWI